MAGNFTALTWCSGIPGLRRLQGLRLGIASSSPHEWVDGYLHRLGFEGLFDTIVCREDAARIRSHPDLYMRAQIRSRGEPEQAIAFEDSPNGVKAAQAAGLRWLVFPIRSRHGWGL